MEISQRICPKVVGGRRRRRRGKRLLLFTAGYPGEIMDRQNSQPGLYFVSALNFSITRGICQKVSRNEREMRVYEKWAEKYDGAI